MRFAHQLLSHLSNLGLDIRRSNDFRDGLTGAIGSSRDFRKTVAFQVKSTISSWAAGDIRRIGADCTIAGVSLAFGKLLYVFVRFACLREWLVVASALFRCTLRNARAEFFMESGPCW